MLALHSHRGNTRQLERAPFGVGFLVTSQRARDTKRRLLTTFLLWLSDQCGIIDPTTILSLFIFLSFI
jgi:hypothetical protein